MTTATTSVLFETGLAALEFARRTTLTLSEDLSDEQLFHQPVPCGNHAAWVLGHLGWADSYFLTKLGDKPPTVPDSWNDLFSMGSVPVSDASKYPSRDELLQTITNARKQMIEWFASLSEEELLNSLPEDWKTFAPTHGALMGSLAVHEGVHTGQLTVVRKSLGLERKLG